MTANTARLCAHLLAALIEGPVMRLTGTNIRGEKFTSTVLFKEP